MKTRLYLLLVVLIFVCSRSIAFSQVAKIPTINGLALGQRHAKDAIIQALGNPTYYQLDTDDTGNTESFSYATNTEFGFKDGILERLHIDNASFKLYDCVYVGLNQDTVVKLLSQWGLTRIEYDDYGNPCLSFYNLLVGSTDQYTDTPFHLYFNSSHILVNIEYSEQD